MKTKNLSFRIPFLSTVMVVAAVAGTISVAAIAASSAVEEIQSLKIQAITDRTHETLSDLFEEISIDGAVMAESATTIEALKAFDAAFKMEPGFGEKMRRAYIENNPNKTGEKHLMDRGNSSNIAYDDAHAKYHPEFRSFTERMEYYDVFLVNKQGDVVYTNFKEVDFGENLVHGRLKDEGLGKVFNEIMAKDGPVGSDMEAYSPSYGAAAAFWGHPIKDASGVTIGAFISQLPVHKFEGILNAYVSEGGTSEAYLIDENNTYVTEPRTHEGEGLALTPIKSGLAFDAKSDEVIETNDLNGSVTYAVKKPIDFFGHKWALVFEIDVAESDKFVIQILWIMGAAGLLIAALAAGAAQLFARSIVKPIKAIHHTTSELNSGNRNLMIAEASRDDEIGAIAKALRAFQNALREGEAAQKAQAEAQEAKIAEQERIAREIESFREDRAAITAEIDRKLRDISSFSRDLSDATKKVATNVQTIEMSSGTTMDTMNTVASAAEELSASVAEINQRTQTSRERLQDTENLVEKINHDIAALEGNVNGISEIATLIQGIATKTSLLALNATIESARAGEAGKGFAVVASEVKDLSAQTANATHDIAKQIEQVREATNVSVASISSITENFGTLKTELMNIISAVDTQAQATAEIAQSASIANDQARTNSSSVVEVAAMVSQSEKGSEHVKKQTQELLELVEQQSKRAEEFFRTIS